MAAVSLYYVQTKAALSTFRIKYVLEQKYSADVSVLARYIRKLERKETYITRGGGGGVEESKASEKRGPTLLSRFSR